MAINPSHWRRGGSSDAAWVVPLVGRAGKGSAGPRRRPADQGADPHQGSVCVYVPGTFPSCRFDFPTRKFSADTYTAGLSYQATRSTILYVTARSGFRSGGFNLSAPPVSSVSSFGPEKVKDVEVGAKSQLSLAGMPMRASVAAFHDRYDDIQRIFVQNFDARVGAPPASREPTSVPQYFAPQQRSLSQVSLTRLIYPPLGRRRCTTSCSRRPPRRC